MSRYGEGVSEPYAFSGFISLTVEDYDGKSNVAIHPDEARLLGLRLIKLADEAEGQEW